jgi:pSer/pThr/pTyr-binding forkhead associated (FHA) protein
MAVRLSVRHPRSAAGQAADTTGEVRYELDQRRIVIGRGAGADVRLPHLTVSDTHATLEQAGLAFSVRDEGSTNGTRVNGGVLVPLRPRQLNEGDQIEIGEFTIVFETDPTQGGAISPERTASLARRMLREMLGREHGAAAPLHLRIAEGPDRGTLVNLPEPPSRLVVGRGEEADLVLTDRDVSRLHFAVERDADGATAKDLESKNGLEVNGRRLRERRLRHGDALRLGSTLIVYQDPAEEALRGLEGQRDVTLTRTAPQALASAEPQLAAQPALVLETVAPVREGSAGTDMLVYALALLVLAASMLGLFWLFGS